MPPREWCCHLPESCRCRQNLHGWSSCRAEQCLQASTALTTAALATVDKHKPAALLHWVHQAASTLRNPLCSCLCLALTWGAVERKAQGALWLPQSLAGQCCTLAKTWHPTWRRCRGSGRCCHCSGCTGTAPVALQTSRPALHAQTHALRLYILVPCRVCWVPCSIGCNSLPNFDVPSLLQHLPSSCCPARPCCAECQVPLVIKTMSITLARL